MNRYKVSKCWNWAKKSFRSVQNKPKEPNQKVFIHFGKVFANFLYVDL